VRCWGSLESVFAVSAAGEGGEAEDEEGLRLILRGLRSLLSRRQRVYVGVGASYVGAAWSLDADWRADQDESEGTARPTALKARGSPSPHLCARLGGSELQTSTGRRRESLSGGTLFGGIFDEGKSVY
jgi:hypothetical protein